MRNPHMGSLSGFDAVFESEYESTKKKDQEKRLTDLLRLVQDLESGSPPPRRERSEVPREQTQSDETLEEKLKRAFEAGWEAHAKVVREQEENHDVNREHLVLEKPGVSVRINEDGNVERRQVYGHSPNDKTTRGMKDLPRDTWEDLGMPDMFPEMPELPRAKAGRRLLDGKKIYTMPDLGAYFNAIPIEFLFLALVLVAFVFFIVVVIFTARSRRRRNTVPRYAIHPTKPVQVKYEPTPGPSFEDSVRLEVKKQLNSLGETLRKRDHKLLRLGA